jgi:hypothetical protein
VSELSGFHKELNENGVGKCSCPMWCDGFPAGFCDKEAYGEQTEEGKKNRYNGYVGALACPTHGGPLKPTLFIYGVDGDKITCKRPDFINLQESPCGFGDTHQEALEDLLAQEGDTK